MNDDDDEEKRKNIQEKLYFVSNINGNVGRKITVFKLNKNHCL